MADDKMTTVDYVMSLSVLEVATHLVDAGLTLGVRPVAGSQHVAELRSGENLRVSSASHRSPIDAIVDAVARWMDIEAEMEAAHGA